MAKPGRVGKKYPYRGDLITLREALELPECKHGRSHVDYKLKQGYTLDEILTGERFTAQAVRDIKKEISKRKMEKRSSDKLQIKLAKKQEEIRRNKAIMAVPQNPITTQEFYMKKSHIRTPDVEPTVLNGRNWMGRP